MTTIEAIKNSWGWTGLDPLEVIAMNEFGNLLIRDKSACIWRLCPEDLYCKIVAPSETEYRDLLENAEFIDDWEMKTLVQAVREMLGVLEEGRRYCLKLPGPVGGTYSSDNLTTLRLIELIEFSGYLANQIKDIPDGTQIRLDVAS